MFRGDEPRNGDYDRGDRVAARIFVGILAVVALAAAFFVIWPWR